MGRNRKQRKDLPSRVYFKHGSYYFVDTKNKWHPLGKNFQEAIVKYAEINAKPSPLRTIGQIIDRYIKDIIPTKAPRTQQDNIREIILLRKVFGHMRPDEVTPQDVYAYMDARPPIRANREKALFSHIFTKAIRWGAADTNPCRFVARNPEKPRVRYINDDEFLAVYGMAPIMIQVAMKLALLTGLRQRDILDLQVRNWTKDGLMVTTNKTGKVLLFERTPELIEAINAAKSMREGFTSLYLICTEKGQPYSSSGFKSIWGRVMKKAIEDKNIERFQWRDIRAKTGSEHETGDILGHQDPRIRERHYRRLPTKVRPIAPKILDKS